MSHIILIGIGGTGTSGIAGILQQLGFTNIIGIDSDHSQITDQLESKGLKIIYGHGNYQIKPGDHVIYSEAAVHSPEVKQAQELVNQGNKAMLVMNYFQFLGEISKYFQTIAIAGTNGKSTSTALALHTTPHFIPQLALGILGAMVPDLDNKSYYINSEHQHTLQNIFQYIFSGKQLLDYTNLKKYYFIVEACEYKRHFLHVDIDYACITNIELDHTDYYQDIEDYTSAFQQLVNKTKKKVFILDNIPTLKGEHIQTVTRKNFARQHIFGEHNNDNGSLIQAIIQELKTDININDIQATMQKFHGLRRRMETIGQNEKGATIISDYAHMASSIQHVAQAIQEHFSDKELVIIFQPHQINRVLTGRKDFVTVLQQYKHTAIYQIYAAREKRQEIDHPIIKQHHSVQEIGETFARECHSQYYPDFESIKTYINNFDKKHIILICSAGDIDYNIRDELTNLEK